MGVIIGRATSATHHVAVNLRRARTDSIGMKSGSPQACDVGSKTPVADGADRRRSERKPLVMEAWICSPTATDRAAEREEVMSMNLSRHGVGFTAARKLPVGSFYIFEVGVGAQRLVSEVRIVSCRELTTGRHAIGAEFY